MDNEREDERDEGEYVTRGERRDARKSNARKMVVSNRSVLLLGAITSGQQRRRVRRRKRGQP